MTAPVTVQTVLYAAAGEPPIMTPGRSTTTVAAPVMMGGPCALCGATTVDRFCATQVVSDNFMDWDRCRWSDSRVFCGPCAWSFKHRPLRTWPTVVTKETVVHPAEPSDLWGVLHEPLRDDTAVIVPISRQKHVAPFAVFGFVRTDNRLLRWSERDAHLLHVYRETRELGVSETAFKEPAPRWPQLKQHPRLLDVWEQLKPWRDDPEFLEVAARATRANKPKEKG